MTLPRRLAYICAVLFLAFKVSATTVSFNPSVVGFPSGGGFLPGNASSVNVGGIQVDGFTVTGTIPTLSFTFTPAPLFGRNESDDTGLGVCSAGESCSVPGGGDLNELSNESKQELIRLTLPTGDSWTSVALSSLDNNGGATPERGVLVGDSATGLAAICEFGGSGGAGGPFTACSQIGGDGEEPIFAIPGTFANSQHIYFVPFDWLHNGANKNNDFLVAGASINPVPEPASLILFGSGLAGLAGFAGIMRRRKGHFPQ